MQYVLIGLMAISLVVAPIKIRKAKQQNKTEQNDRIKKSKNS
jgi:uncharacterized membrane protein YuzA (DUF378 family)